MNTDKLPKWAQQHIRYLEHDLVVEREKLAARNHGNTDVTWTVGLQSDAIHIPNKVNVEWKIGPHGFDYINVTLMEKDAKKFLRIEGGQELIVLPTASNAIRVRLAE